MSPVTHFLTGWLVANRGPSNRRSRALITLAGVAPDIDGLGIVPELITRNSGHPLLWFSLYHHSLHTLAFGIVIAAFAFFLTEQSWRVAALVLLSFHLHLFEDLIGSRGADGYQWPVPYLKPFSSALKFTWNGQWELNAWQNYVITSAMLFMTLWLSWQRAFSRLEMLSAKADRNFIVALRKRFPMW
jgi:inner membrane protein